jgi:hypothetical protein
MTLIRAEARESSCFHSSADVLQLDYIMDSVLLLKKEVDVPSEALEIDVRNTLTTSAGMSLNRKGQPLVAQASSSNEAHRTAAILHKPKHITLSPASISTAILKTISQSFITSLVALLVFNRTTTITQKYG